MADESPFASSSLTAVNMPGEVYTSQKRALQAQNTLECRPDEEQ